jgi:hypothetical protein
VAENQKLNGRRTLARRIVVQTIHLYDQKKKEPEVNCTSFVFVAYQESAPMRFFLHVATLFRDHTTTFLSVTSTVNPIIIANKKLCDTMCWTA